MLHRYGYSKVVYIGSRDENYDGRPNYKFRACKHGTKYNVYVSWYGDILNTREIGQCYSYNNWRRNHSYDDDGQRYYRQRPDW